MIIKLGDTIQLNRNIGRFNKGDIFTIDEVFNDVVYVTSPTTEQKIVLYKDSSCVRLINKGLGYMFRNGDIIRLKVDTWFYEEGLLCRIINAEPFDNAMVEIIERTSNNVIGCKKYANLKLFELVERKNNGLYI